MNIFKIEREIKSDTHGFFTYYFVEPFSYRLVDGIDTKEAKYTEMTLDLNKLFVVIKKGISPFTGKEKLYYFFKYKNEDIYIEDYDSTSETFIEKIVKNMKNDNITYL